MQLTTFEETFDERLLNHIINHYDEIKAKYNLKSKDDFDHLTMLEKYLENSYKNKIKVTYKQRSGRLYAVGGVSLQSMKRIFRETIAQNHYVDIDMCNAHPVILLHLCRQYGFETSYLDRYVNERESLLKHFDSRSVGKKTFLAIMNGGISDFKQVMQNSNNNDLKQLITGFRNEMLNIHKAFADKFGEEFENRVKQRQADGKDYNHEASLMNVHLCRFENKILNEMWTYFGKSKSAVLCFDGIMLPRLQDEEYDLDGCMEHIKDSLGIDMKITVKPFENIIDISKPDPYTSELMHFEDHLRMPRGVVSNEMLDDYFKNAFKIIERSQNHVFVRVRAINYDTDTEETQWVSRSFSTVKASLPYFVTVENQEFDPLKKINKKNKKHVRKRLRELLDERRDNRCLEMYSNITFIPYLKSKKNFNLRREFNAFPGFTWDNDDIKTNIDFTQTKMYSHLRDIICGGREGEFNHFISHLADIIQDPAKIKNDAHFFLSIPGCGKGLMAQWFNNVLGNQLVYTITNPERYFKNSFNSSSTFKLVKIFEELKSGFGENFHDRMKAEITCKTENLEHKGSDVLVVPHFARFWFFTNNENSIYVDPHERRFTIHKCSSARVNDREYFNDLVNEIENKDYLIAAFKYLSTYKYDPGFVQVCYETEIKRARKEHCFNQGVKSVIDFVTDFIISNSENFPKNAVSVVEFFRTLGITNTAIKNKIKSQIASAFDIKPARMQVSGGARRIMMILDPDHIRECIRRQLNDNTWDFETYKQIEDGDISDCTLLE